jgi:hypothetical protein
LLGEMSDIGKVLRKYEASTIFYDFYRPVGRSKKIGSWFKRKNSRVIAHEKKLKSV